MHPNGVQWRFRPNFEKRIDGCGPACGNVICGHLIKKGKHRAFLWVSGCGYLPVNFPDGTPILAKVKPQN